MPVFDTLRMACTERACCPIRASCPSHSDCQSDPALNPACGDCLHTNGTARSGCRVIEQVMWPDHCLDSFLNFDVAEYPHACGMRECANLTFVSGDRGFPSTMPLRSGEMVFHKGQSRFMDAYSIFADNTGKFGGQALGFDFDMHVFLEDAGIDEVYFAGLAEDFCVGASACDAATLGFRSFVIGDATRAIADDSLEAMRRKMRDLNVVYVTTSSLV
jgi:nicotinamidase-related amidase